MPVDSKTAQQVQTKLPPSKMAAWNLYQAWLQSKGLAGNSQMNSPDFSQKTLAEYKKINPNEDLNQNDIIPIQSEIHNYRTFLVNKFQTDPIHYPAPKGVLPDYSNFMSAALGTGNDGINGVYTSTFRFPNYWLTQDNQQTGTIIHKDLGFAPVALNK